MWILAQKLSLVEFTWQVHLNSTKNECYRNLKRHRQLKIWLSWKQFASRKYVSFFTGARMNSLFHVPSIGMPVTSYPNGGSSYVSCMCAWTCVGCTHLCVCVCVCVQFLVHLKIVWTHVVIPPTPTPPQSSFPLHLLVWNICIHFFIIFTYVSFVAYKLNGNPCFNVCVRVCAGEGGQGGGLYC